MSQTRTRIAVVAAFALLASASGLWAATTVTQSFTMTVPSVLSITAPSAASATHDATDANQAFPAAAWTVAQNQVLGTTATFSVSQAFTHATALTKKRDCKLTLALGTVESAASWTVVTANDQTDYANLIPDNAASVQATSTGAGNATLNLTVTFLDTDYSTIPQGAYSTTVTGTVAAN